MNEAKVYVDVTAKFLKDGTMIPVSVSWIDGQVFEIQKVTDVRRAASFNAGGVGIRYTCIIDGRQAYLFYEDKKMWFVERKARA